MYSEILKNICGVKSRNPDEVTMKAATGIFLLASGFFGQTTAGTPPGNGPPVPSIPVRPPSNIPTPILYRIFFQHIVAVDGVAANLDAQGKPGGSDFRAWYQNSIRLSDQDTAALKQNAAACTQAVAAQEVQIKAIVDQFHAANPKLPKSGTLPPPPPQLQLLVQGRTDITNGCIQTLQSALSAGTFTKVDSYVRYRFSQNLSVQVPAAISKTAGKPYPAPPGTAPGGGN